MTFSERDELGQVTYVDTEHVVVQITVEDALQRIRVGNIVALETSKVHERLIAIVDKVTRKYVEEFGEEDEEDPYILPFDNIRVNIIGTYYAVLGEKKNIFKRGVDIFPRINSKCFLISGVNLQHFMSILCKDIVPQKRLKIGAFAIDNSADAVLDGNKFSNVMPLSWAVPGRARAGASRLYLREQVS